MPKLHSRYLVYAVIPVAALALLVSNVASAHGWGWGHNIDPDEVAQRQQEMFEHQAEILGTNIDTVKNAWAEGQTMLELAEELDISETDLQAKMKTARQAQMKEHLQTLVSQGVITQAQADQRYAFMKQRLTDGSAKPGMGMGRGGRHGGGLGGFGW